MQSHDQNVIWVLEQQECWGCGGVDHPRKRPGGLAARARARVRVGGRGGEKGGDLVAVPLAFGGGAVPALGTEGLPLRVPLRLVCQVDLVPLVQGLPFRLRGHLPSSGKQYTSLNYFCQILVYFNHILMGTG